MLEKTGKATRLSATRATAPRVAIVAHAHPSVSKGGGEIAAYTLFQGLNKIGVHTIFIAMCADADRDRLSLGTALEYAVFHRPETYEPFYHLATPETSRSINKILEAERISVVNFHHFFSLGLSALRGASSARRLTKFLTLHEFLAICHHHGQMVTRPAQVLCEAASPAACAVCYPEFTRQQFAIRKSFILSALREMDAFVSPGNFLAQRYITWGLPAARMSIIENGLAGGSLAGGSLAIPGNATPSRGAMEQTRWTFAFFGQINPFKGVDMLLQAAEILRRDKAWKDRIHIRVHGNLVGQGSEFVARFERAARDSPVLSWPGPYDNATVGRLMADCDYVLVPSRWWENSPVVIQEAFAARRPVICTGIGGMAEKVKDGISGLHFRVNDHYDFIRVLQKAADAETFHTLQAGLPLPYDGNEMARRYSALFTKTTAAQPV
jgi:glycosyltransferase involved in cell wall biosynthesis